MKRITTVRIEEKLLEKAKKMGINLSKFLEYNLNEIIKLYEEKGCGRRDLNPGIELGRLIS